MSGKEDRTGRAADLRRRAEAAFREKAAPSPDDAANLSPEEVRRTLHELRVHQIELQMQNEELRSAQAALDGERARYFDLYDLAPVGYVTVGDKGLILEANLTAATLLGVTRGQLIRQPFSRFVAKESQDVYYRHRKELFENGRPLTWKQPLTNASGKPFWALLAATAAQDDAGRPVCRITLHDISESKRLEDEQEFTARLAALVNAAGDFRERMAELAVSLQGWSGCEAVGIRLQDGDDYPYYSTEGFPTGFVEAERHLCAYDHNGELLRNGDGNPVLECMCGNVLRGRIDPAQPFFTARGSFWSNGTTALLASTSEADRQAHTRNRCNGEGYESVALIPLHIGRQAFGLLQFNDRRPDRFTPALIAQFERMADGLAVVLAQRQAAESLSESEERYRTLADSATDAIVTTDAAGRIVTWNRAAERMFDRGESEALGLPVTLLMPERFRPLHEAGMRRLLAGGEPHVIGHTAELSGLRKSGEEFPIELALSCWESRQHRFSTSVIRDITERVRMEAERERLARERVVLEDRLRQSQKVEAIGRLAGGVAHDFNNITAIVLGYAELLLAKLGPEDPARKHVEQILAAGRRSATLTRQLLAFSRRQTLQMEVLDLNALLRNFAPLLGRLIGEDIDLELKLAEGLGRITADAGQLEQVLTNLAVNARDAMPDGGKLTVETAVVELDALAAQNREAVVPGRYALLTLTDSGCGMDEATLGHLFEPFYTTKEKAKGTGLGLATAYGIVKQFGGYIWPASEPGVGTTFRIHLPLTEAHLSAPAAELTGEVPRGSGELILLVEDEAPLRELCATVLAGLGYRVSPAASGPEALRLVSEQGLVPDLVLTDVIMPGMSGAELARRLDSERPGLKVLYMSGYPDEAIAPHGILEPGTHFIQKPFTERAIAVKISRTLAAGGAATAVRDRRSSP